MKKIIKEPRIWLAAAIYILEFLPYFSLDDSTEIFDYSYSSSVSMNGYSTMFHSYLGDIILLIPLACAIVELGVLEKVKPRIIYVLGSILGIILAFTSPLLYRMIWSSRASGDGYSYKLSTSMQIGFWLIILDFLVILVITIMLPLRRRVRARQAKALRSLRQR